MPSYSKNALLSGVMHDIDGKIGLNVKNGFDEKWRAFGDGFLNARDKFQWWILGKIPHGTIDMAVDANFRKVVSAIESACKQLHYQAQKTIDHAGAQDLKPILAATRGNSARLAFDDYGPSGSPGTPGAGRDAWIAMDISTKIAFLRNHQPIPLDPGSNWMTKADKNVPVLIDKNGIINIAGGYEWETHKTKLNKDRVILLSGVGEVDDISQYFQLAHNMPSGADWYGPLEIGIISLLYQLKQR